MNIFYPSKLNVLKRFYAIPHEISRMDLENFENVLRFSTGCFRHKGDYLGCESEGLLLTFLFIENVQERET